MERADAPSATPDATFSPDPVTDDQLLPAQGLLELLRSLDPQN
ncbi:hypothetical protein ACN6K9_002621 [Streptomyces sp. SAS_267]